MPRYNRFRRWTGPRRSTKPAVTQTTAVQAKGRRKCAGCGTMINAGDTFVRLRLGKRYAQPCSGCAAVPKRCKRYHAACVPADINAAMHYDPTAAHVPISRTCTTAAPPKPPTAQECAEAAIASLEAALIAKVRGRVTPEIEKEFKTFQGIKARVLRPGTPGEGECATGIALQRIVKMIWAS